MDHENNFVQKSDKLAGVTTLILIILGIVQIILGETVAKSIALTANGIDCIGDGFVSAVVWIGLKFFQKPADNRFHYGYYRMENLASAFAAIVMIGLAIYIMFRSYNQLLHPEPVQLPLVGAVVAGIAAIIALALGFFKMRRSKISKMGSVKLEAFNTIKDGTASGLAVVALILASQGFLLADAIVGFIIAGIITTIGFAAIKESSSMLVDACDRECIDMSSLLKILAEDIDGVDKAQLVRLRRSGPILQGELEITVPADMTIQEVNKIKKKIRKKLAQDCPDIEQITISATTKELDNN